MPSFIAVQDSLIYNKYILPVISSSLEFQIFKREIDWQAKALEIIKQITAVQEDKAFCELATLSLVQKLWLEIYENADMNNEKDKVNAAVSFQARLQIMMQDVYKRQ